MSHQIEATTRRSASIDSSRRGQALLVTWEDATSSEEEEVAAVSSSLQENFGYQVSVVHLKLDQGDRPGTALLSQVQSLLIDYDSALNPLFLYYCGKAVVEHGSPFWTANTNSSSVDWLTIQVALENRKSDIILALDCDYGSKLSSRDRQIALAFRRVSTRTDSTKVGKLEVIATIRKIPNHSFGHKLAAILEARRGSLLSVEHLLLDLQKDFGSSIIHKNISPSTSVGNIEMIPVVPISRLFLGSETEEVLYNENEKELVDMVKRWNNSSHAPIRTPAREGYYRKVVVLPIIWVYSDWGARVETELLKKVFKKHFGHYQVEETYEIRDNINAQQKLEDKIDAFIGKVPSTTLTEKDLLIVMYNGHGKDGAESSCNMIWEGGKEGEYSIDWTKIVRKLDAAPCDILQILDCCFSANGSKSKGPQEAITLDHIHEATAAGDYHGTNEILASTGRDNKVPAGEFSSMRLFADVLTQLAAKDEPISVYSWFYEVDSEAVRRNIQILKTPQINNPRISGKWWHGPAWKCHPKSLWPKSIILRPNSIAGSAESQNPGEAGHIYAQIKIENGRPTDVVYYTRKGM